MHNLKDLIISIPSTVKVIIDSVPGGLKHFKVKARKAQKQAAIAQWSTWYYGCGYMTIDSKPEGEPTTNEQTLAAYYFLSLLHDTVSNCPEEDRLLQYDKKSEEFENHCYNIQETLNDGFDDKHILKLMELNEAQTISRLQKAIAIIKSDLSSKKVRRPNDKAENEKSLGKWGKNEGSEIMLTLRTSKENWEAIRNEYDVSKKDFGKKINFVSDSFKREIIFRDVEHAFVLASHGFSKPALILSGGVIEELLRHYLEYKNVKPQSEKFVDYIKACEENGFLKRRVSLLSDSIRDFRNLVHLCNEESKRFSVSKATAKGAVSAIFTIANYFR
jgi:hypothetical protein